MNKQREQHMKEETGRQSKPSKFIVGRQDILQARQDMISSGFIKMKKRNARDYMLFRDSTLSVSLETPLVVATEMMQEKELESLPVIENGRLLGVITMETAENYLPHKVSPVLLKREQIQQQTLMQTAVGDVMNDEPTTILPDTSIREAAQTMLQNQLDIILVVDQDDFWLGILRLKDILHMVARS